MEEPIGVGRFDFLVRALLKDRLHRLITEVG